MPECVAEPLSRKDLRVAAKKVRILEGSLGQYYFDIVHFLDVTLPKLDSNFNFWVRIKEEMGECHGITFPDRNEIQIRADVYKRACNGSGRDRLTMAHELFHLMQHEKENISFARVGKNRRIETFRDPEWQADAFGGELLIPHHLIGGMTAEERSIKCGVSLAAAKCQLRKY